MIVMSILTISLVFADFLHNKTELIHVHLFLGGISVVVFFGLCKYGFEQINWVLLAISFVFVITTLLFMKVKSPERCYRKCIRCKKIPEEC
jgi:hypothetical protein